MIGQIPRHQLRWLVLLLVSGVALLTRLALLTQIEHPGLWDPTHYYLLGRNLLQGKGFTIDYIWHYLNGPPAGVSHPIDYWMPLPGILAALGMALGGDSVQAAILPFALLGAVQAALAVWLADQLDLPLSARILAGLGTAFLPDLLIASLHTDTTVPFSVLAMLGLIAMWRGLMSDGRWLWLSGMCSGLALLTRNDGLLLLPVFILSAGIAALRGHRVRLWHYAGFGLAFLLVVAPWVVRNVQVLGMAWPGGAISTAFTRHSEELYVYATPLTLERYLAVGLGNMIQKRLFELTASLKLMAAVTGQFFGAAIGGLGLLLGWAWWKRGREGDAESQAAASLANRLFWPLLPALLLVLGGWLFYGLVTPIHSQGGSFKKLYLGVLPLLMVGGAAVVTHFVRPRVVQWALSVLVILMLLPGAFDIVRDDLNLNRNYASTIYGIGDVLADLQAGMDRELILMTRDPWSINYLLGYRTVMVPEEDLETILAVADRYGVTHILLPVPRAALEGIYAGTAAHPRLQLAASVPDTIYRIYAVLPPP
ncbi:MAG: hypothetical protein HPY64_10365 [Anaerolineae bacterium]|nr:hypothetical protein [Anaerolineae bacterium]